MTKSKFELTIESFEKMDLNMLDVLLNDNMTYQSTSKAIFLQKLEVTFTKLKKKGDTYLVSHKGSCNSSVCPNTGCGGYSFIGDTSKEYIDLIIEEKDGDVEDLFYCHSFVINDPIVEIEKDKEKEMPIKVSKSEDVVNKVGTSFLVKAQPFINAYDELYELRNKIIDKTIYLPWLDKHIELIELLGTTDYFLFRFWDYEFINFDSLYSRLSTVRTILKSDEPARKAIKEFETVDVNNDKQLLKWLVTYEVANENLSCLSNVGIDPEFPEKIEQLEYLDYNELMISAKDFVYVTKLKHLFDKYYWDIWDKYVTYTNEEINDLTGTENEHTIYSLTFHVNRAGINLD